MKKVISCIRGLIMNNKSSDEALLDYLKGSKLILNAKFGTYLNNVVSLDLDSLLSNVEFESTLAIATSDCPKRVLDTISLKMPVKVIDQGSNYSDAMEDAFELMPGDKLTIIGRISPYHKRKLEAKGVTVFSLEVSDKKSCTNLELGRIDCREVINRYVVVKQ
jgi:hypothetical protein